MQRALTPHRIALFAIVVLAALLRFYGLNWDQGLYLHPDERFIAIVSSERIDMPAWSDPGSLLDPAASPLNPRRDGPDGRPLSFAYGSLPLYVQSVASWLVNVVAEDDYQSYAMLYRVGRPLTVVVDLITLIIVYLIGRRIAGPTAGLVAAMLYATAVLPIQLSHFFTVDIWLTLFVSATLYLAIRYVDQPTLGRALALGVPVGCAFATKASVAALLVPLGLAALVAVSRSSDRRIVITQLALAGIVAVGVFSLFEPYAIVRFRPFYTDIRTQADIVRGIFDVPFTRQFVGLTPGLYEARNLFLYGLGPALLVGSVIATGWGTLRAWRQRDVAYAILIVWVAAYGVTLLSTEAKFLRYSMPLVPVFAALVGAMLARPIHARLPRLRAIATMLGLGATAIWALGFSTIYDQQNSRIAASRWMFDNIPAGYSVSVETWDDALPLPYPGAPANTFVQVPFDMYGDLPPDDKVAQLAANLAMVDYVILSSSRLVDSVDNEPWRYAVQIDYYRRLTAGQLGFQLVYDNKVEPGLFGLTLDDRRADESFTVYDHPHVRIYKKVDALSSEEIRERLLWGVSQPWYPMRYEPATTLMLGEPASETRVTDDADWNGIAARSTPAAVLLWVLAVELIGLAVLPLAALVLRRSFDRGAFSARAVGLLLVGWLTWIGASIGWWPSRTITVVAATLLLAAGCWVWYLRRRTSSAPIALPSVRVWLAGLAIWGGVFAFFLALRAAYPDFWQTWFGGEKPFELAYLRAVARSTEFPPYDPWYSGGTINYYYYGWHLVATLIKMTGVGVGLGFQLAVATIPGLLALQVVGLATALARRRDAAGRAFVVLGGSLAIVAVSFVGNLDAVRQFVESRSLVPPDFDFWRSTRVIPFTINEFPYFTAIWADLHPHLIDLPVIALVLTVAAGLVVSPSVRRDAALATLGVLALAFGTTAVTNSWDAPLCGGVILASGVWAGSRIGGRAGASLALGGVVAVALGLVMFLPFFAGFYSVVGSVSRTASGSPLDQFLTVWGIFLGILFAIVLSDGIRRGRREPAGRDAIVAILICLTGGTIAFLLAALRGDSLPLSAFVALWLAAAVVGAGAAATMPSRLGMPLASLSAVAIAALGATSGTRPAAAIACAFVIVAGWHVLRRDAPRAVPWSLAGLGCLAIAGVEWVYISDDLSGGDWQRMNTVFKFYNQAWLLLGAASALLLARTVGQGARATRQSTMLGIVARPIATRRQRARRAPRAALARMMASGIGCALLALGLLYPLAGTPARLSWDMPSSPNRATLDGYAWMEGGSIEGPTGQIITFEGDLRAIEWLDRNVDGNPVMLEASIGPYRGNGSRISSATGLPTVLGWDRHQRQQRYPAGIDQRMADVRAIYNEADPQLKLEMLRRYDVRFVIVGDVERFWNSAEDPTPYASAEGLAAFERLVGDGMTLAFEAGNTRVYEVTPFASLPPLTGAIDGP